jgi:hypothetical protein
MPNRIKVENPDNIPGVIKEETEDIIILNEDRISKFFWGLTSVLFSFLLFLAAFNQNSLLSQLLVIIVCGLFLFWGLSILLVSISMSIDKKSQSIIFKKTIIHKNYFKEIPFSVIKELLIVRMPVKVHDVEIGTAWRITITTIQGTSVNIYKSDYEHDVDRIAVKISGITGKEILYLP